jgi:diketogulonate reductase-like aldo/keto reductase
MRENFDIFGFDLTAVETAQISAFDRDGRGYVGPTTDRRELGMFRC